MPVAACFGARSQALADQSIALAVMRHALKYVALEEMLWIGMQYDLRSEYPQSLIRVAVLSQNSEVQVSAAWLSDAVARVCAQYLPGVEMCCQVVDAKAISTLHDWITVMGCHPNYGLLPAYVQLDRLLS